MLISEHINEIETLNELGFTTNPLNRLFDTIEESFKYADQIASKRDSLNYPIDGAVIKLNDNLDFQQLGVVGKTPRAWSAIKFPPKEVITQITDITYQIGRTGKITPVAELNEVELQGTVVKRATLHNTAEVMSLNLHFNDSVVIRKAGDIIPEILSVLINLRDESSKVFLLPTTCPSCNNILTKSETGIDLYCNNINFCPDQIKLRLSYFTSRQLADINGLSEKTIEKFIQNYKISSIADLYNLPYDEIAKLEGFGNKSSINLQESIEKAKIIADYKLIAGLSIEGVGIENAKLIAKLISKD